MNVFETVEKLADEMIEEDFPLVFDTLMRRIKKMDTLDDLRESFECAEDRLEREQERENDQFKNINIFFNQDGAIVGVCDDDHLQTFLKHFPEEEYEYGEIELNDL